MDLYLQYKWLPVGDMVNNKKEIRNNCNDY